MICMGVEIEYRTVSSMLKFGVHKTHTIRVLPSLECIQLLRRPSYFAGFHCVDIFINKMDCAFGPYDNNNTMVIK